MKKSIIAILIGLVTSTAFQGCDSSSVDEINIANPVGDTYYATAQGYTDLINSCYTNTRAFLSQGDSPALLLYGTDMWTNASDAGANEFNSYSAALNPTNSSLFSMWSAYYVGIAGCNAAIDRAKGVSGMTQAQIDLKAGEAYFLRAWYYHQLISQFGGVPLKISESTEVETTSKRNTEAECWAQVISDLLKAEAVLPVNQADFGRATKGAAQGLLARVYLWTKKYAEADTYAKKVIASGKYKLLPSFSDIFNPANTRNEEVIFSVQFSKNIRANSPANQVHLYFTPRYDLQQGMTRALEYDRPYPRYMASRFLLDLMQSNRWRDARYDQSWRETYFANRLATAPAGMKLGDTAYVILPRIAGPAERARVGTKYKIIDISFYYNGENPIGALEIYPKLTKYDDPNRLAINDGNGTKDIVDMRFSEMYEISGEAQFMLGNTQAAVDQFNIVRARAAKPGMVNAMKFTTAAFNIDSILNERALEFAGEGSRWMDLKRTGKLQERITKYNPKARVFFDINKHTVRPIPSRMIDVLTNTPEEKKAFQNPGY